MNYFNAMKFREKRIERGWTLKYVGNHCGVTAQTVCDWEKGRRSATLTKFSRLCQLFEISKEEIGTLFLNHIKQV